LRERVIRDEGGDELCRYGDSGYLAVIESIIFANPRLRVVAFLRVFQKNARLQARARVFADPG
jgi:hypothetical protein